MVHSVLELVPTDTEDVWILDTEASLEHLARGTARHVDSMLVVVEPYFKSLETGRRTAVLARDLGVDRVALVANKVRDPGDLAAVRALAGSDQLEVAGVVPFDPQLPAADRALTAPLDLAPEGVGVAAIGDIARRFAGTAAR